MLSSWLDSKREEGKGHIWNIGVLALSGTWLTVNREKQISRKVSSGLSMWSPSSRQPDLWRLRSTGEVVGKHGKDHGCPEVQIV